MCKTRGSAPKIRDYKTGAGFCEDGKRRAGSKNKKTFNEEQLKIRTQEIKGADKKKDIGNTQRVTEQLYRLEEIKRLQLMTCHCISALLKTGGLTLSTSQSQYFKSSMSRNFGGSEEQK